jgi:A/G-specific adenine glycosylase
VLGRARAGPSVTAADRASVEALLPAEPAEAARFSAAVMELGALVCTAGSPGCARCPVRMDCAWHRAGAPAHAEPRRKPQRFEGTDRQVRGRLLDVLRGTAAPVSADDLGRAWTDSEQRSRALVSLLRDGLVVQITDGRFGLAGEGAAPEGSG